MDNYNVFPNPTNNIISVEFELEYYQGESIELLVRDLKGTIIKSIPLNLDRGYNFFNVNLNDVPKGSVFNYNIKELKIIFQKKE